MQRFNVPFEYPVVFTRDVLAHDNDALEWTIARLEPDHVHRCTFVIDDGVARTRPDLEARIDGYLRAHPSLQSTGKPIDVVGGEVAKKDRSVVDRIHEEIASRSIDRHSCIVAIGGGAMLDAVGFAAATAHRGVRIVRVPTTVLAQNDAGIGVKNGINAHGGKNFLGSFAPPLAVVNDIQWLESLPARDRIAGSAEAVKVALIRDAPFFDWLQTHAQALAQGHEAPLETMIRRCAELHLRHIREGGDPFEYGSARPLDYGHWAAHQLELLSEHTLRHGEAVSIGMLLDAHYAHLCGALSEADLTRIEHLLEALGLPCWHETLTRKDAVLAGLEAFREHLGGVLTITLLRGIGDAHEVHAIDAAKVATAIETMRQRAKGPS